MPTSAEVGGFFGAAFADDPVWQWMCGPSRARLVTAAITQLGHERRASSALPEIDCLGLYADLQRQFKLRPSAFLSQRPNRLHIGTSYVKGRS